MAQLHNGILYSGPRCEVKGCPGIGESCSRNGYCSLSDQTCHCDQYWTGPGCNLPDCPGEPDCNRKGVCDIDHYFPPRCVNCTLSMGPACEYPCIHGKEYPPFSTRCVCDPCYSGGGCQIQCSNQGVCENSVCHCQAGYKGEICQTLDCPGDPDCSGHGKCSRYQNRSVCVCDPGFTGDNCSILICPGTPTCSGNGMCELPANSSVPACTCNHGYMGADCSACQPHFTGPRCERCQSGYIGYNTTCSIICLHGNSTEPGGHICQCYSDDINGHWTGAGCDECVTGWNLPTCTECAKNYVGPGKCDIPCINKQGTHALVGDGLVENLGVEPMFQCIQRDANKSTFTAWFGYKNNNPNNVYIPVGPQNSIGGTKLPETFYPTTKFRPSEIKYAFYVGPLEVESRVWWHLASTRANIARNITVDFNKLCDQPPTQSRPANETEYCKCLSGFWGSKCENSCEGGSARTCYGKGTCDPVTGHCSCYASIDQSTNCSTCLDGWIGADCSVALLLNPIVVSGFYQAKSYYSGHFVTYDGAMYNFVRPGEYLLTSVQLMFGEKLNIHVLQMISSSVEASVGVYAVGVSVGSSSVVVTAAGASTLGHGSVWHNKQRIPEPSRLVIGQNILLSRLSVTSFKIEVLNEMIIYIYIFENHLDLHIEATAALCQSALGLLSKCDGNPTNDFVTQNGLILTSDIAGNLTQVNIHDVWGPSWSVHGFRSLFSNILKVPQGGGFCIKTNGSHAVSDPLYSFVDSDTTIEIKFKADALPDKCGTIWSYKAQEVFSIILCGNELNVYFQSAIKAVNALVVRTGIWYHLSVVWVSVNQRVFLYLIKEDLTYTSNFLQIDSIVSPLRPGGKFILGQWSETDVDIEKYVWNFVGYLDDFRIWKKRLLVSEILSKTFMYVLPTEMNLSNVWRLNEGIGHQSMDPITGVKLTWIKSPWLHPLWDLTEYKLSYPDLSIYNVYSLYQNPAEDVKRYCYSHIYSSHFNATCRSLGEHIQTSFYQQCLFNVRSTNNLEYSMEVILAFADICMPDRKSLSWPARTYCKYFPSRPFPIWTGISCNMRCLSGSYSPASGVCQCSEGFFGSSCENLCSVSREFPCGGGTCNTVDGLCTCSSERFNVTTDCAECATGWVGLDCSSASVVLDPLISHRVCSSFGYGHFIMADGQGYTMRKHGEFILMQSNLLSVYLRQVPCTGLSSSCTQQVWIKVAGQNLTIQTPLTTDDKHKASPLTWLNGQSVEFDNKYNMTSNVTLQWSSHTTLNISLDTENIFVKVSLKEFFLETQVIFQSSHCTPGMEGLCGNCDGSFDNDFKVGTSNFAAYSQISSKIIDNEFASYWSLEHLTSNGFIYSYGNMTLAQSSDTDGFNLYLNGSGTYTSKLPASVIDTRSNLTIEIKIKASKDEGVIMGYQSEPTFTVYLNKTLWVQLGRQVPIEIKHTVSIGTWHHLSLVYNRNIGNLVVYLCVRSTLVLKHTIYIGSNAFQPSGIIRVGSWQENAPQKLNAFVGEIDELRIWKSALDVYMVMQSARITVNNHFTNLVALWTFNSNTKNIAVDIISNISMVIPSKNVYWWISDLVQYKEIDSSEAKNYIPYSWTKLCRDILFAPSMVETCQKLGYPIMNFFYEACIMDITESLDDKAYVYSASAYADLCTTVLRPEISPLQDLCTNTNNTGLQLLCSTNCKFGYLQKDGVCICDHGYWGWNCGKACPGGVTSPCNNKGFCDTQTGRCHCYLTYNKETDCDTCLNGRSGPDCELWLPELSSNDTQTGNETTDSKKYNASMFGQAYIITFQNVKFTFTHVGEFYILKPDDDVHLEIQVRVVHCYSNAACLSSIAFKHQSDVLVVQGAYTSTEKEVIWRNGNPLYFNQSLLHNTTYFTIEHSAQSTYEIRGKFQPYFYCKIRVSGPYLSITIQNHHSLCQHQDYILGSCHPLRSTADIKTFKSSWIVEASQSLFKSLLSQNAYGDVPVSTGAGHSLLFNGSSLSTGILLNVISEDHDLTLELYVKPHHKEGVIITYSHDTVLCVYLDMTVKIQVGNAVYDTNLTLQPFEWHQLTLVLLKVSSQLVVYVYSKHSSVMAHASLTFNTALIPLKPNGVLTYGSWRKPFDPLIHPPTSTIFVGEIDEVRIWQIGLPYHEVQKYSFTKVNLILENNIVACWRFDEGEGLVVYDLKGDNNIHFVRHVWSGTAARWMISSLPFNPEIIPPFHALLNKTVQITIESKCHSVIYQTFNNSVCSGMDSSKLEYFYFACASHVASSGSMDKSIIAAIALADFCQIQLELPFWPGNILCQVFSQNIFPFWTRPLCDLECRYPNVVNSFGSCSCENGYWGSSCTNICPGGILNPCNNNGYCIQTTGQCQCSINWQGSTCNSCATGWTGEMCSVAIQKLPRITSYQCSLTSNGHLSTFDGANVQFTDNGIFQFFERRNDIQIQIQKGPCGPFRTCVISSAIKISNKVVTISGIQGGTVTFMGINAVMNDIKRITEDYQLKKMDPRIYHITGPKNFLMEVSIKEGFLDIFLTISRSLCSSNGTGVCGVCEKLYHTCHRNDHLCRIKAEGIALASQTIHLTSSGLLRYFKTFAVINSSSLFASFPLPTAGYAVSIKNGWLITKPIDNTIWTGTKLTVELRVRILSVTTGGTILTYSLDKTFGLTMSGNYFHIHFGSSVINTSVQVVTEKWSNIALIYDSETGILIFHYICGQDISVYTVVNIGIGCFPIGGTMAIGSWQTSVSGEGTEPQGIAVLDIDRILVWNRVLSPAEIDENWKVNIRTKISFLALGWNFDDGSGLESLDFVSQLKITCSYPGTSWIYSDIIIQIPQESDIFFTTVRPDRKVNAKCTSLFFSGGVSVTCGVINTTLTFFYLGCMQDTMFGGHDDFSMDTILMASTICQYTFDLNIWPGQGLCNMFTSRPFPIWTGLDCDKKCVFGTPNMNLINDTNMYCDCNTGFWGTGCDLECPGGYENPCNQHGKCDMETGECYCVENWAGDKACSSCTKGYSGTNCEVENHDIHTSPSGVLVCAAGPHGTILDFGGKGRNLASDGLMAEPGDYTLLQINTFTITVQQISCMKKKKEILCIDKVEVNYENLKIRIENTGGKNSHASVRQGLGSDTWLKLTNKATLTTNSGCTISVVPVSRHEYTITSTGLGLGKLKVTVVERSLSIIMKVNNQLCCSGPFSGLCVSSCKPCQKVPSFLPCGVGYVVTTTTPAGITTPQPTPEKPSKLHGIGAGNAVCFTDSSMTATKVPLFQGPSATLELFVKTCADRTCHGTILSYSKSQTFSIRHEGTVVIKYGPWHFNTHLPLQNNEWNQIAIVYEGIRSKRLDVYVFNSTGSMGRASVEMFGSNPFTPRGTLALGRWQPPNEGSEAQPNEHFVGCIDELRIWNRYFTNLELSSHWNREYKITEPDLIAIWRFDENTENGDTTDDRSNLIFYNPKRPFKGGNFVVSSAPIPFQTSSGGRGRYTAPGRKKRETIILTYVTISDVCTKIFTESTLSRLCKNASSSIHERFRHQCINSDDVDDAITAIMSYADLCQFLHDYDAWPGQQLCEELFNDFDLYLLMGEFCNPPCYFGTRNSSLSCQCLPGYWNITCNAVCPGGVGNPCNGYETCDQLTGRCNCPVNRQGSEDCVKCSSGWHGSQCDIVEDSSPVPVEMRLAIANVQGDVYTLDGLAFRMRAQGEYFLLSISVNIIITAKMVICNTNYTCMTLIALRIGDDVKGYVTVTVKGNAKDGGKPHVYINNQFSVLDTPAYFNGFSLQRTSLFDVSFDVNDHCTITIKGRAQYLLLYAKVPTKLVNLTSGILSGRGLNGTDEKLNHLLGAGVSSFNICRSMAPTQVISSSPSLTVLNLAPFNHKYGKLSFDFNITNFEVSACDSFIFYPLNADRSQTMGGYSLQFSSSIAYTTLKLDTIANPNISFELQIRPSSNHGNGVLFSFANNLSFTLISKATLLLQLIVLGNTTVLDTDLILEQNQWNKLIVTYYSDLGYVNMYLFNSSGFVERRNLNIMTDIFRDAGQFCVGHWYPPSDGQSHHQSDSFEGQIDNILIWNIAIEPTLVKDVWAINPNMVKHLLHVSWQLNEGQGKHSYDDISFTDLSIPQSPWLPPDWYPSDIVYSRGELPEISNILFSNNTMKTIAESTCTKHILNLTGCDTIKKVTLDFFYLSCLHAVQRSLNKARGYDIAVDLHSICQVIHNFSDTSLTEELCNQMTTEERSWTACKRKCVFGFEDDFGTCTCLSGYYGASCDSFCPGGSENPCSGHGTCLSNGTCHCQWNWQGFACQLCSHGLLGPDCVVFKTDSLSFSLNHVATVMSTGHYITFNGQNIHFKDLSGAFLLFESPSSNVKLHIYQVICNYGACIAAMAINTSTSSLVILPSGTNIYPKIYKDGQEYKLGNTTEMIDRSISVSQSSLTDFEITITSVYTMRVTVLALDQFLQIVVTAESAMCGDGIGILGSCTGGGKDYTVLSLSQITQYIADTFLLTRSIITDILLGEQEINVNSGYALFFNGTATVSNSFHFSEGNEINGTDFSLSMYFKPGKFGGTVMSYAKTETFSIHSSDPLSFSCGERKLITSVSPILNIWNQLVLTFKQSTRQLQLFHFGINASISHDVFSFSCPDLFTRGGSLMLGEWMPSPNNSGPHYLNTSYTGLIDEISIWKKPIPETLVFQAFKLNVKLSGFTSELVSLMSFTEGIGYIAYEEISGNNLYLPSSPWQSPKWKVSDLTLRTLNAALTKYKTYLTESKILALCAVYFNDNATSMDCPGIPSALRNWHHHRCLTEAGDTGYATDVFLSMVDYAAICVATGGSYTNLYKILCKLNVTQPRWLSQRCSLCKFGYLSSRGNCVCYYGYYGTYCQNTCPGGAVTPCNNHGMCDTGGHCQCSGHWSGTNCDQCQYGWDGQECIIFIANHSSFSENNIHLVAQVTLMGQILTFDGVMFDVMEQNVYNLLTISSLQLSIHMRFSFCKTDDASSTNLCPTGLALIQKGMVYYISYESFFESQVNIQTSSGTLSLFDTLVLDRLLLKLQMKTSITITCPDSGLLIRLTAIDNRLMVIISLTHQSWLENQNSISGLVASCSTVMAISTATLCNVTHAEICSGSQLNTSLTSCFTGLTYSSLKSFMNIYVTANLEIHSSIDKELSTISSTCMFFNNSGITVKDISFPPSHFTLEMHLMVTLYGGVILTYEYHGHYICLINAETGIQIFVHGIIYNTGITLEINTWNQLSLAWKQELKLLEMYITYNSGITVVNAVPVPVLVFTPGGSLTIGQVSPGLTVPGTTGIFIGMVDEVRVWSRPINPSIIKHNWRVEVSTVTADVVHSWSFNEGKGYLVGDSQTSQKFFSNNVFSSPTWVPSSLNLSPLQIDLPSVTNTATINTTVVTYAEKVCSRLIEDATWSSSSALLQLTRTYYKACIEYTISTRSSFGAEAFVISAAELKQHLDNTAESPIRFMCKELEHLESYLTWTGTNCSEQCIFGTSDSQNICKCLETHWGETCANVCPLGPKGACNSYGLCDSHKGDCSCTPHWFGRAISVQLFWSNFALAFTTTINLNYACSECSKLRHGSDCHISVDNRTNTDWTVGILYGSYISTLDGASFEMISLGAYQVYKLYDVSVQVLFWPCLKTSDCRQIKEISIQKGHDTVSIQHISVYNMTALLGSGEKFVKVDYPYKDSFIGWTVDKFIRITISNSFSILVYNTKIGLFCGVKITRLMAVTSVGILGNTDGDWLGDIDCSARNQVDHVSGHHVGTCLKSRFSGPTASSHLQQRHRNLTLTSAGYIVRLSGQKMEFRNFNLATQFTSLTVSYWIKIERHMTENIAFFVLTLNKNDVQFVMNKSILEIIWGATHNSGLTIHAGIWAYISFVWQSSNGDLVLYIITEAEFQHVKMSNVNVNLTVQLNGICIRSMPELIMEVEYIRVWSRTKELEEIVSDMRQYSSTYTPGLELVTTLDDGSGLEPEIMVNTGDQLKYHTGTITDGGSDDDLWIPSSIPVPDIYLPKPIKVTDSALTTSVVKSCLNVINNTNITDHCPYLGSVGDVFLEACIREYLRNGKMAVDILLSSIIFYCQGVYVKDDCLFSGYLDFCQPMDTKPREDIAIWIIIVICVSVAVAATCCCCIIICCIIKKKKKRNAVRDCGSWEEVVHEISQKYVQFNVGGRLNIALQDEDNLPRAFPGPMDHGSVYTGPLHIPFEDEEETSFIFRSTEALEENKQHKTQFPSFKSNPGQYPGGSMATREFPGTVPRYQHNKNNGVKARSGVQGQCETSLVQSNTSLQSDGSHKFACSDIDFGLEAASTVTIMTDVSDSQTISREKYGGQDKRKLHESKNNFEKDKKQSDEHKDIVTAPVHFQDDFDPKVLLQEPDNQSGNSHLISIFPHYARPHSPAESGDDLKTLPSGTTTIINPAFFEYESEDALRNLDPCNPSMTSGDEDDNSLNAITHHGGRYKQTISAHGITKSKKDNHNSHDKEQEGDKCELTDKDPKKSTNEVTTKEAAKIYIPLPLSATSGHRKKPKKVQLDK